MNERWIVLWEVLARYLKRRAAELWEENKVYESLEVRDIIEFSHDLEYMTDEEIDELLDELPE